MPKERDPHLERQIESYKGADSRNIFKNRDIIKGIASRGDEVKPRMMKLLEHEDREMRECAIQVLTKLKAKDAMPTLMSMFRMDPSVSVQSWVLHAIKDIGEEEAVPYLLEALDNDEPNFQIMAAKMMVDVWGEKALGDLIKAHEKAETERGRWGIEKAIEEIVEERKTAKELDEHIGDLRHKDPLVRQGAAATLGEICHPDAIPYLIEALKDEHGNVRESAAGALAKIGDGDAVSVVVEALKDKDKNVRQDAAQALGKIGNKDAIPALVEALKDEDFFVRWSATISLGEIAHVDAIPALAETLKGGDDLVRGSAAQALGEIGHVDAVPALVEGLKDKHIEVRESAAEALGKLGSPGLQALIKAHEETKDEDLVKEIEKTIKKIQGGKDA